jgi:hypothetical protein
MVSTIVISPKHNENIPNANQDFKVVVSVNNLATGQFTNPNTTYYSAPQQLNSDGIILGHTHITIQVRIKLHRTGADSFRIWEHLSTRITLLTLRRLYFSKESITRRNLDASRLLLLVDCLQVSIASAH